MLIFKLREQIGMITAVAVAFSKDLSKTLYRMNWQLEQLTGAVTSSDLGDWKERFGGKKKKKKKEIK